MDGLRCIYFPLATWRFIPPCKFHHIVPGAFIVIAVLFPGFNIPRAIPYPHDSPGSYSVPIYDDWGEIRISGNNHFLVQGLKNRKWFRGITNVEGEFYFVVLLGGGQLSRGYGKPKTHCVELTPMDNDIC